MGGFFGAVSKREVVDIEMVVDEEDDEVQNDNDLVIL